MNFKKVSDRMLNKQEQNRGTQSELQQRDRKHNKKPIRDEEYKYLKRKKNIKRN